MVITAIKIKFNGAVAANLHKDTDYYDWRLFSSLIPTILWASVTDM
jgi:hypothetical protein